MEQYFSSLSGDKQNLINNTPLLIYVCEGTESEIKEWFKTINIAGIPLNNQELLNAVYSGTFVTKAKEDTSVIARFVPLVTIPTKIGFGL